VLTKDREVNFKRFWNSEALFVMDGANEFPISQQKAIFYSFSKLRIYNCIILNRENSVADKEYSRPINANNVDTDMKFGVYTWFPYQCSDRCTEVNDITLLDSGLFLYKDTSTKNNDLFPGKISKNLKGCRMKTVVREGHRDFTTKYFNRTYSEGDLVRYIVGLETNLFVIVWQQMNMKLFHVPAPEVCELENVLLKN